MVVVDVLTMVICWNKYVYDVGRETLEIPYNGTAVLIVPPTAVMDKKLVGGFKYQALDAVDGNNTNENTYVC